MIGRREFGLTGLSAIALASLQGALFAQSPRTDDASQSGQRSEVMAACAKACSECQRACDECSTHCIHQLRAEHGEHKDHLITAATCQDCAEFCAAASQIVARGGPFAALICQSCSEACARCAEACEKFPEDEKMKRCGEECRKCEKACKDMVQQPRSK